MKKVFGKIIMSQWELDRRTEEARIRGRREAQKPLSKDKRDVMLGCGFFPVTDDFWLGVGMVEAMSQGFDWAYFVPDGKRQKFMPFHGWHFVDKTSFEIKCEAKKAKTCLSGGE